MNSGSDKNSYILFKVYLKKHNKVLVRQNSAITQEN